MPAGIFKFRQQELMKDACGARLRHLESYVTWNRGRLKPPHQDIFLTFSESFQKIILAMHAITISLTYQHIRLSLPHAAAGNTGKCSQAAHTPRKPASVKNIRRSLQRVACRPKGSFGFHSNFLASSECCHLYMSILRTPIVVNISATYSCHELCHV